MIYIFYTTIYLKNIEITINGDNAVISMEDVGNQNSVFECM